MLVIIPVWAGDADRQPVTPPAPRAGMEEHPFDDVVKGLALVPDIEASQLGVQVSWTPDRVVRVTLMRDGIELSVFHEGRRTLTLREEIRWFERPEEGGSVLRRRVFVQAEHVDSSGEPARIFQAEQWLSPDSPRVLSAINYNGERGVLTVARSPGSGALWVQELVNGHPGSTIESDQLRVTVRATPRDASDNRLLTVSVLDELQEITRQLQTEPALESEASAVDQERTLVQDGWRMLGEALETWAGAGQTSLTEAQGRSAAEFLVAVAQRGLTLWKAMWGPDGEASERSGVVYDQLRSMVRNAAPEVAVRFTPLAKPWPREDPSWRLSLGTEATKRLIDGVLAHGDVSLELMGDGSAMLNGQFRIELPDDLGIPDASSWGKRRIVAVRLRDSSTLLTVAGRIMNQAGIRLPPDVASEDLTDVKTAAELQQRLQALQVKSGEVIVYRSDLKNAGELAIPMSPLDMSAMFPDQILVAVPWTLGSAMGSSQLAALIDAAARYPGTMLALGYNARYNALLISV